MRRASTGWTIALAALLAGGSSGCVAAAAAAGAGAGWYYTSRGAESQVQGSMDEVASRTHGVLAGMDIEITDATNMTSPDERTLKGKLGADKEVTVELDRSSESLIKVEVTVQDNLVQYDKETARRILEKIVGG
jgi:hypothetical protein